MTVTLDKSLRDVAVGLLHEAFDRARRNGKAEWRTMTTAVLKNRLLQITGGSFSIESFGVDTVADFVALFPDLLRIDENPGRGPSFVTLIGVVSNGPSTGASLDEESSQSSAKPVRRSQIRADLWRAAMDWDPSHEYVIDPVTGRARERTSADSGDVKVVQAVSKETYLGWRTSFIEQALEEANDPHDKDSLNRWREEAGPSRNLPSHLQDRWMSTLRTNVATHIREWFESVGFAVPDNVTSEAVGSPRPNVSAGTEMAVATQKLREVVRSCVDAMSYEELQAMQFPASVVARALAR